MPAIRGKDGISVTGEIIKAKEVKDKTFKVGQGAIILDNGNKVVAATSGTPVLKDGAISVIPLLILSGDVDVKTGYIDFNGNILIKGNVMDNSKVTARGMIKVLGSVYNSEVIAGEDIKIFGGVIGSGTINVIRYYSGTIFNKLHKASSIDGGIHKLIETPRELA
ncbi:MAG: FapA family protein [Syntrophomonadaceae bacterium]|nr:FapA family protein [Syntrophomonadaceae bacterium]